MLRSKHLHKTLGLFSYPDLTNTSRKPRSLFVGSISAQSGRALPCFYNPSYSPALSILEKSLLYPHIPNRCSTNPRTIVARSIAFDISKSWNEDFRIPGIFLGLQSVLPPPGRFINNLVHLRSRKSSPGSPPFTMGHFPRFCPATNASKKSFEGSEQKKPD